MGIPLGGVLNAMHALACTAWACGRYHDTRRHLFPVLMVPSIAHARCRGKVCGSGKGCRDDVHVSCLL